MIYIYIFFFRLFHYRLLQDTEGGFPCSSVGKESACSAGDPGSIPVLGRSPGEGNGNPLQYSCLDNSMDRGAWWVTVHGVTKEWGMTLQLNTTSSVQLLSCVRLFATPWTAACQASLSITNSSSLLKLMSIESVTPSNHLIFCHPLLLCPA